MVSVLLLGLGEDEDIIQIDKGKLIEHVPKNITDWGLEESWGVGKTKRHDEVLVVSCWGVKCCLALFTLSDVDKMVGIA